jgi:hypothetical protein
LRVQNLITFLWMLAVPACNGLVVDPAGEQGLGSASERDHADASANQDPAPIGIVVPHVRNDVVGKDDSVVAPANCDLAITEVAVFQSVKSTLWQEGKIVEGGPLLVAGKGTLFRVFVSPGPHWADKLSKARLILTEPAGSIRVFETEKLMVGPSVDGNGSSTFNFSIQGTAINTDTKYQVELDMGPECRRFESSRSVPRQGPLLLGAVNVPTLEVVLVPMAYDADKSHRLPDTSVQQLERIKAAMLAMLPLRDVRFSVRSAVTTDLPLDAQSFPMYLDKIRGLRMADNAGANVHYIGLVMPAASLGEYCKGSCTAGLAFGNLVDDPSLRVGVALGFPGEEATRTLIHELGHTLGLKHAPCNTSDSVDPAFPYEGGLLGVWGYDERQHRLRDPAAVGDFMGYCTDHWISDYSYNKIMARLRSFAPLVGAQSLSVGTAFSESMTSVWVPTSGPARRGESKRSAGALASSVQMARWQPLFGPPVDVQVQSLPVQDVQGRMWMVPSRLLELKGELALPGGSSPLIFPSP